MTKEDLQLQIENATKLVNSWPQWKQKILIQSAQPTVSSPRTPVNNQECNVEELTSK